MSEPQSLLRKLESEKRIDNTLQILKIGEPYLIWQIEIQ
jgi:hypothetical protein